MEAGGFGCSGVGSGSEWESSARVADAHNHRAISSAPRSFKAGFACLFFSVDGENSNNQAFQYEMFPITDLMNNYMVMKYWGSV